MPPTTTDVDVLPKHKLEKALHDERKDISSGRLKEENPLDTSLDFRRFCEACRRGDLKACQEQISKGVNINARDEYDYTPLILASLCGHFEVAQMLLEQGALCERDTFQGERCLYNALNDRIRNLLLSYDYSKSADPLQPLAAHVTGLLTRVSPKTSDITVHTNDASFELHKFVLSARSPYFRNKLALAPETTSWKLSSSVPTASFETCMRYIYLGDASMTNVDDDQEQEAVLGGIDKLSRQLEIPQVFENILQSGDRRQARQRRTEELERARDQLAVWFERSVIDNKLEVDTNKADDVKWDRDNGIFADVLLRADHDEYDDSSEPEDPPLPAQATTRQTSGPLNGIPIGHFKSLEESAALGDDTNPPRSTLFPAHRAMLLRSDVLATMFASPFRESHVTAPGEHLPIIPIDCSQEVLRIILTFVYTERVDFPLALALDVLHAADMLFVERLKQRAALLISTLGNGGASVVEAENPRGETDVESEAVNIYDVVRAGWTTRVHRLEEFGARFLAYRLERHIDSEEFRDLVRESAARIKGRQETDTVELVDDVRYYLSERFRLRFEDSGIDGLMKEEAEKHGERAGAESEGVERDGVEGDEQKPGADASAEPSGPESDCLEGHGIVKTLEGGDAGDEFAQDAMNYQILLGKLETLMEELGLDG